jgi:hypothetical protein
MIGHAPSLTLIWDDGLDPGELFVALVFATSTVIAISMIVAVLSDKLSQARVSSAARVAAENAARETSPDLAMLAAKRAAAVTLTDLDRFGRPMIVVDVSRFQSAGLVEVTVACTVAPRAIGPIDRAVQLRQATASASIRPGLAHH